MEILVVVAIMATMVSVGVVSVMAGQGAARVKGATRDIMASIRRARSQALVLMQPVVVTYSTMRVDDDVCAQIEVEGAQLMNSDSSDTVQTLSGETVMRDGTSLEDHQRELKRQERLSDDEEDLLPEGSGDSMEQILFSPISTDVVKGIRLKVTKGDELLRTEAEERKSSNRISVFSNVDYLLGKYKEKKEEDAKKADVPAGTDTDTSSSSTVDEDQEPVSVIWETNGRCDPHRVWIYRDGSRPEDGLCIKVDHFGAVKVISGDEED